MLLIVIAFFTFHALGGLLLWMTFGWEDFREKTEYVVIAIVATVIGFSIAVWAIIHSGFSATGLVFAPGGCMYAYVVSHAIGHFVVAAKKGAMGDNLLVITPTYHQAEAAEKRRDYVEAERLYRVALAERPDDSEAKRRIAELHVLQQDYDGAERAYRALIADTPDPEAAGLLVFRLADLLSGPMARPGLALALLRDFESRHPDSKAAAYARERAGKLGTGNV